MDTLVLCGRAGSGGPGLLCGVPDTCANLMNHVACSCGGECLTRFGTKCGNARGFTGKRQFKFFPTCSLK